MRRPARTDYGDVDGGVGQRPRDRQLRQRSPWAIGPYTNTPMSCCLV